MGPALKDTDKHQIFLSVFLGSIILAAAEQVTLVRIVLQKIGEVTFEFMKAI